MMPGEIECRQDCEEKKSITPNTCNNASPPLIHSVRFRPHRLNAGIDYFPFGRKPFFSKSAT